jgi:two-component system sensor histidine kinase CpxA
MKVRFPLYLKILLWLSLNLLFLAVVFYVFLRAQFHFGLDSLLMGRAGDRVQAVSEVIAFELNAAPKTNWNEILNRFAGAYHMQFFLFRYDGAQVAGDNITLPTEVQNKFVDRRVPPWFQQRDGRPGPEGDGGRGGFRREPPPMDATATNGFGKGMRGPDGPRPDGGPGGPEGRGRESFFEFRGNRGPGGPPPGPTAKFMLHTLEPSRYWVIARIPVFDRGNPRPMPVALLMMSDSIRGGGLFFDVTPWLMVGAAVIFVSVLFWSPLVRGITRSISQITRATEQIAEGGFDARVNDTRRDELGRLGQAINRMAVRLSGFVMGQKRFLGDIAHELCSPIARMQVALGILEERAQKTDKAYVDDVREEVQHMSNLVNELLSFSKAGLKPQDVQLQPVPLAQIAQRVVTREASASDAIQVQIAEDLVAMAEPELLQRALGNLLRNALRYAGGAGPIVLSASANNGHVTVTVSDCGPGVPEETLGQIFDPFFRLESSRSRDTGGIGLGLAIVKTCVESCQGTVSAKNRQPTGLQVEIKLEKSVAPISDAGQNPPNHHQS